MNQRTYKGLLVLCCLALLQLYPKAIRAQSETSKDFKKTVISRDFISEGVATADLNKDGQLDIIAGYFWFEAPSWKRHEMAPSRTFDPRKEYSESFLNLGMDVNLDGWDDVVIVDYPGKAGFWFENPKNRPGNWPKHIICLLYTSDAADDLLCVDLGGRRIIKK